MFTSLILANENYEETLDQPEALTSFEEDDDDGVSCGGV